MMFSMRFALLAGLLVFAACGDDHHDHHADGGSQQSKLERSGSLPRPPKQGLPAELRPPR